MMLWMVCKDRCTDPRPTRRVSLGSSALPMGLGAGLLVALLAGCLAPAPAGEAMDPQLGVPAEQAEAGNTVLVRGRILPTQLVVEPVFRIDTPASPPREEDGPHRLRGFDQAGEVLFDLRFQGARVAGPPGVQEEHFALMVPVGPGGPLRLERVELETADGRTATRTAALTGPELLQAMQREDAVRVEAVEEEWARVRWDLELFPAIMVRDPETGTILSFADNGDIRVRTAVTLLEVTVSDGVRSLARKYQIR